MTNFTIRPWRRHAPRWLARVLRRIHALASSGRVQLTLKALQELAGLDLGLDEADACATLQSLHASDSHGRLRSGRTGEWLYVFIPRIAGEPIYVKLLLRTNCVIVSFHAQVDDEEPEADS
jgi:hypothetical protein